MNKKINNTFRDSIAFSAMRRMKYCIREIKKDIKERKNPEKQVISLYPKNSSKGKVLLSYIINGFLLDPDIPIPTSHTNVWQSINMAETFVELGYEVDVIHYLNNHFIPKGRHQFFVDVRHNMERLSPLLNKDCVKIMHIDSNHILFHNFAEAKRLLQLQKRRNVTLRPRRLEMPNLCIEHADYATSVGNDLTDGTFKYANKKIYRLPSPCAITLDWKRKEWNECRKNFLWFNSGGLVHKGLDLALEAFKEISDSKLIVCGPVDREEDFLREYYKEIYETKSIKTIGWVDIDSEKFREIVASCGAVLNFSCSEAGGTSTKTCMHAGLIPIVSSESGVDIHDFGFMLKDCSIANIKKTVKHFGTLSEDELQKRSKKAWEFAVQHYTRDNFDREYRRVILEIINEINSPERRFKL